MPSSAAFGPLEFYKTRFKIENGLTSSVLKAIPPARLDYRPHERSPSTGQIAWAIVRGLFIRIDMALQGASDVVLEFRPSFQEMLDRFEDASRGRTVRGNRKCLSPTRITCPKNRRAPDPFSPAPQKPIRRRIR
jgi:hypothetical protein